MNWEEKETPSLELCKRLKELGFPQKGEGKFWEGFWWVITLSQNWHVSCGLDAEWAKENKGNYIKAPTCRELGEWLPIRCKSYKLSHNWYCEIILKEKGKDFFADTEPNVRSKMLIWLIENGYVNFKGGTNEREVG